MKTIVNMILNLRKMEMGKNILHLSTAHPNEWLKDVLDSFRDEFSLRGITLQFIPSPDAEIVEEDTPSGDDFGMDDMTMDEVPVG